jgi:hypothetical protein
MMIRKLLLVLLWFPITLVLLVINLTMLAAMPRLYPPTLPLSAIAPGESGFAASSGTPAVLSASVIAGDARTLLLQKFLQSTPMAPYADLLVEQADQYGFDFRLLPAIAMCESNLGKRVPLKSGFNPFGIAVYTGSQYGKDFDSWDHAITWVSKYIYDKYYSQGITKLVDIQTYWAPPAAENGNSWATCVQYFEDSILQG